MDKKPIEAFTQAMEPVYKNLILLLTIFILLSFGVYVSYILNDNTNRPIYLSENSFDLFENSSNLNSITSSTTINNVTVKEFNNLGVYQDLDFCPQGQCSVNLSTGIKICPSNIGNNIKNNNNQISVTYDKSIEVCVDPESCPPQLPYAINNDGSALTTSCEEGFYCYCTAQPQCATRVLKVFENQGGNPGSAVQDQLNYSFSTSGDKINNNLLNNIILTDVNDNYCQLNPAYTDKIINGCNFANKWTDPLGCQYTNIYNQIQIPSGLTFSVANYSDTIAKFKNLAELNISTSNIFNKGLNFIGVKSSQTGVSQVFDQSGSVTITDNNGNEETYIYQNSDMIGDLILLNNLKIYNTESFIKPGLSSDYNPGNQVVFNKGYLSNCQNSNNDKVNFKNMLTCVQPYNQPCSDGVLAYNANSQTFCQGTGVSLSLNNLNNFFLINPAFYTLSCVIGGGCDDSIDTNLCAAGDDCQLAFQKKLEGLLPEKDYSALTNLFSVQPSSFGISYEPFISSTNNIFTISNNLIPLEVGDYFEIKNNINGIFLTSNAKPGTSIINVNNATRLKKDMVINFSETFTIHKTDGTSVFLSDNLTNFDSTIAKAGFEIVTYSNQNYFGIVANITQYVNKQTFQLYNLSNNLLFDNTELDIENNYITFYKQFGFNGLNYNTVFDFKTLKRNFSNSYYYKQINNTITPPFTVLELLQPNSPDNKINSLHNETANFKQKYSMYYPVFNEEYFRQECVYCSPSLQAFTFIDDDNGSKQSGGVSGINIQFSGQDYYHYAYGNINNKFQFNQTSFYITADSRDKLSNLSNCSTIVLGSPAQGIVVGDYIVDQFGFLNKDMVNSGTGESAVGNFKMFDFPEGMSVLPDDKFLPYKLNGTIFKPKDNFDLDPSKASFVENVYYGKAYFKTGDNNDDYYIRPTIQVVKISSDRKTIYTNSPSIHPIPDKSIIQFISSKNNLSVDIIEDPQNTFKATGKGAILELESIAQGRIVSLLVTKKGQGYSTLNRPLVYINQFSPDTSLLNIST